MNTKTIRIAATALMLAAAIGAQAQIGNCYTNLEKAGKLKRTTNTRYTQEELTQQLGTSKGTVTITAADAWHMQYTEKKQLVPFVSVQVQKSAAGAYSDDREKIMAHVAYSRRQVNPGEPQRPVVLNYNGYTLYGYGAADERNIDNRFVMFTGNNTIVYFHFQAPDIRDRSYDQVQEYLARRNNFMGEYTARLNCCMNE
jgi:hypothetical protein